MQLSGIHHLTAVSADARGNHAFYTGTLGMRMVKKSVNQDDTSAYHLFYADAEGSPGTDMTFFEWPVGPERRGTHSIARTCLRVAGDGALDWWRERLSAEGAKLGDVASRGGRACLDFEDREGQRLTLIDDGGAGEAHPWDRSPVPADRQIRGLGPIVLSVPVLERTAQVLTEVMNMTETGRYEHEGTRGGAPVPVHVFSMGAGGPAAELHVAVEPGLPTAHQGAGGVHHVAFRTPDADYDRWAERLAALRVPNSGRVDRFYFRSLYFREPNGILFEIASDGPGFHADEPKDTMGEKLALPPFLEPRRKEIEAGLKPL